MKVLLVKNMTTQSFSAIVRIEDEPRTLTFEAGSVALIFDAENTPELRGLERAGVKIFPIEIDLS